MSWFLFAILSAIFWGTEGFLEKIAGRDGYNSNKISLGMAISASVLSLLAILFFRSSIINISFLIFIAFCNALSFLVYFISRIESLRTVAASIFFPVSKVGTLLVQIIFSLLLLHEHIVTIQWLALIISIIAIYFLTWTKSNGKKRQLINRGFIFLLISTFFAATTNFAADVASHKTEVYSFSFFSYLLVIPSSWIISKFSQFNKNTKDKSHSLFSTYRLAFGIGALNFLGLVTFFLALKTGLFSIVGAINNFSILLTILLAVLIHKERPSLKQTIGIILSFLALFLFNP